MRRASRTLRMLRETTGLRWKANPNKGPVGGVKYTARLGRATLNLIPEPVDDIENPDSDCFWVVYVFYVNAALVNAFFTYELHTDLPPHVQRLRTHVHCCKPLKG